MKIKTSKKYSQFKSFYGNRNINLQHVKKIIQSMEKQLLFTVVIVNEKMEIIDGQHRFEALKRLNLPINYAICENYGLNEVQVMNQYAKNWNAKDYMQGYIDLGYKDYSIVKSICDEYGISVNVAIGILGRRKYNMNHFKAGAFTVYRLADAKQLLNAIQVISNYYTGAWRRTFMYSLMVCCDVEGFSLDEFIRKLKMNPLSMREHPTIENNIRNIEDVYNYHRRKPVRLY